MRRSFLIPSRDAQPLYIQQSSPLPNATQGVFYSFQFSANGGTAPYTWSLPGQTGTNGWIIVNATGEIRGTPANSETNNLSVRVTDAAGTQLTSVFSVTVAASGSALSITTTSPLPSAAQGSSYSFPMAATGGTAPYTWSYWQSQSGSNGWSISSAGNITGTPSTIETDTLFIRVTDSAAAHVDGTFSLPVGVANSFFADPYSSYALNTRLVDPVNGIDSSVGNGVFHTWGGVSQVWTCYKTLSFAVTTYFINAGVRLGLLDNTTYTVGGTVTFPTLTNGALGANSRRIIQGDPSSTSATMPVLDGIAISLTDNNSIDKTWTVLRKFELKNIAGTGIFMSAQTSNSLLQYLHVHDCHLVAQDNVGCIYFNGSSHDSIVEFCKLHDVTNSNGAFGGPCIENYWAYNVTVRNCEGWNASALVELKGAPASVPPSAGNGFNGTAANGWTITRNIMRDMTLGTAAGAPSAIAMFEQGNLDPGWQGMVFTYNLCYHVTGAGFINNQTSDKWAMGTTCLIANNTIAEDCGGFIGGSRCLSAVTVIDNFAANTTGWCIAAQSSGQPAWSSSSTYNLPGGTAPTNAVHDTDGLLYKTLQNGNLNHQPSVSPTWWLNYTTPFVTLAQCDHNVYGPFQNSPARGFADQVNGVAGQGYGVMAEATTFASWQAFHTNHPTYPLCANGNPDLNSLFIPNLTASWNTVAKNMNDPNYATSRDYTLNPSSPLATASSTGGPVGYDPTNCGPEW